MINFCCVLVGLIFCINHCNQVENWKVCSLFRFMSVIHEIDILKTEGVLYLILLYREDDINTLCMWVVQFVVHWTGEFLSKSFLYPIYIHKLQNIFGKLVHEIISSYKHLYVQLTNVDSIKKNIKIYFSSRETPDQKWLREIAWKEKGKYFIIYFLYI